MCDVISDAFLTGEDSNREPFPALKLP